MADELNWRMVGQEIARGMADAGNSSSFSSSNPSGGSRVDAAIKAQADALKEYTKAQDGATKQTKKFVNMTKTRGILESKETKKLAEQYRNNTAALQHLQHTLVQLSNRGLDTAEVQKRIIEVEKERVDIMRAGTQAMQSDRTRLLAGLGALAAGVFRAAQVIADDVMVQLQAGSQLGVKTMQTFTVQLGMSTEAIVELESRNRQIFNVLGGTATAMQQITDAVEANGLELARQFGGLDEAAKFLGNSMGQLARSGIVPNQAALDNMTEDMASFRRVFGTTPEQFLELNNQLMTNADIRYQLQGLDKEERQTRMQAIREQIKLNGAMGMTSEQAIAAASRLAELSGQGARSRIQQAARLQAMAAAFGVGGGAEAAAALRAGSRATPEQTRILQTVLSQLSETGARLRTEGTIGQELAFQEMSDRLGLDKLIGKGSEFNTALTETQRIQVEGNKQLITLNDNYGKLNETAGQLALRVDQATNIINDKFISGLLGATNASALLTSALGVLAGAALGTGGPGGVTGTASSLMRGLIKGGIIGAAAYGGYQAGEALYGNSETVRDAGQWVWDKLLTDIPALFGNEAALERQRAIDRVGGLDALSEMRETARSQQNTAEAGLTEAQTQTQLLQQNNDLMKSFVEQFGNIVPGLTAPGSPGTGTPTNQYAIPGSSPTG